MSPALLPLFAAVGFVASWISAARVRRECESELAGWRKSCGEANARKRDAIARAEWADATCRTIHRAWWIRGKRLESMEADREVFLAQIKALEGNAENARGREAGLRKELAAALNVIESREADLKKAREAVVAFNGIAGTIEFNG